jgi:hypothetical protein
VAWSAAEAAERLAALGRDVRAVREEERRYREAPRAKRKSMPPLDQRNVPARLHAEGKKLQEDRDRHGKGRAPEIQQAIRSLSQLVSEWNSPLMQESAVATALTGLDLELHRAGCTSTRVRVLAAEHPREMAPVVDRYARLSRMAEGSDKKEERYDALCTGWYLADELRDDDRAAIRKVDADTRALEKEFSAMQEATGPEIDFLAEEYRGDVRAQPSGIDLALAKFARSVAQVAFPGGHVVEVLHGGHCTINGAGMAPLERLRSSPVMRDFSWQAHHYVSPPLWQGTLEGRHGGSIHVHRQEGTAGATEDDTVSVYFTPGCGRAAARKALEEAGFHNFEE